MARNDPQVNLRMPAALKDALDNAASANKRSLTAEIVARLEASLEKRYAPGETMTLDMHTRMFAGAATVFATTLRRVFPAFPTKLKADKGVALAHGMAVSMLGAGEVEIDQAVSFLPVEEQELLGPLIRSMAKQPMLKAEDIEGPAES